MAKISRLSKSIKIKHPQFPELIATCRVLEPIEAMDIFGSFQQYQKVVPVIDNNGNLIRKENGELETHVLTHLPASAVLDILHEVVENVEGLEDEDGPIKFSNTAEFLKNLFKREINVELPDGSKTAFADYIQSELNKLTVDDSKEDKKLPKGKTSPKQQ